MDPTIPTARICAIGEAIPAEKPWLDPARPGRSHGHVNPAPVKARCGGPALCSVCAEEARRARHDAVREKTRTIVGLMRDEVNRDGGVFKMWLPSPDKPTIVIDWHSGAKSLYALDTDETAEQVVEHLRRQRGA